jgi:hypothetical protein
MKWVAFILLALLLLATIGGIVLWAKMPTARFTVHAVRPMGTNLSFIDPMFESHTWPVWEIAVTNNGSAKAEWFTVAVTRNPEHKRVNLPTGTYLPVGGALNSGCSTNVYMALALPPNSVWAVAVRYISLPTPLERKLWSWSKPVPRLRRLLPNVAPRFAYDIWHSGTNVTTAP